MKKTLWASGILAASAVPALALASATLALDVDLGSTRKLSDGVLDLRA
ncbi:hypothetical protein BH18ACI5_BH18ACI5_22400 [soil metagenome]